MSRREGPGGLDRGMTAVVTLRMLGFANARGQAIAKALARRFGPERVVSAPGEVRVMVDPPDGASERVREVLDSLAGDWDEYLVLRSR
jgi:hypothetical protein